ncbi:hypothetical protein EBR43_09150 [bacterium]|nr:hypothetical protein [bacterium]
MNKIFLGHHCYGIEAAAQLYFGKNINTLTLSESAILAGLPKAPSMLNPLSSIQRCQNRRDLVLEKMLEYGFISQAEHDASVNEAITASYHKKTIELAAPTVVNYVVSLYSENELNTLSMENQDIWTTINSKLQLNAQSALDNSLIDLYKNEKLIPVDQLNNIDRKFIIKELQGFYSSKQLMPAVLIYHKKNCLTFLLKNGMIIEVSPLTEDLSNDAFEEKFKKISLGSISYYDLLKNKFLNIPIINGAIVSLDSQGAIKALVGSTSYSQSTYNRAIQTKRPIGSTIKSLIYAQAFDQKFNLTTEIQDSPHNLIDYQGFSWRPSNSNKNYLGTISVETAFIKSVNLATISLAENLDLDHLWRCLEFLSKEPLRKNPSLILGSHEMSPLELATIYTSFCNKGLFNTNPYIVEKQSRSNIVSLCSEQSAYLIRHLQKEILKSNYPKLATFAGGKTGTTNDHADLWFAGFHHNITTVVWIGYDKPQSTKYYASQLALPIWSVIAQNDGLVESTEPMPHSIVLKKIGKDLKPFWIQKAH